ncbi:MAG: BatD family protein [Planctomycetes bacterium]|nr:BatD family protein [Planctomycetota bacterium]
MLRSFVLAVLTVASTALAQEKLEIEGPVPATLRLGDSARVTIRVEGRGADPRTPTLPVVAGLRMQISPPSRSSYTFFDGRTMTERVGVEYQLTLQPTQEGEFVVPPFTIWTGTRDQSTKELRLDVRRDLRGEDLAWLDVKVEPQRVYVHEPIRVTVDFGVQQGLRLVQDRLSNGQIYTDVEVQAPWLVDFPGGEPIEPPRPPGELAIVVLQRTPVLATREGSHERNGERWQRFTFERSFLPTRLGRIELSAPMLRYHRLVREGQPDIFGGRRGQQSDNFFVYGKPITLDVLPIPEAGRPTPYYGAVGRFTIAATLDKDTVRVGNSVKLTLTVRGDGNFEFLRLPPLDQIEGFHKLGQAEAVRDADKVVVTYDLTPLSVDVKAVPPIAWNWFDTTPGVEKFVEVKTASLPLHVTPLANGETLAPLPEAATKAVTAGVDDVFDLPPLDGPPRVRVEPAPWQRWAALLGPWVLVASAMFALSVARRRSANPAAVRARAAGRHCERALQDGVDPVSALADYLGARVGVPGAAMIAPDLHDRLVRAGVDAALVDEVVRLVERGTAARYGGGAGVAVDEVRVVVGRLERLRFGVATLLPLLVFAFAALGAAAGPALAQEPAPQSAEAAYRAKDWAAAERLFAERYEATGDRRLLRARGNCFYRAGDLPRALWAFESARLGDPRDPELLANLRLVRTKLEVDDTEAGFVAELTALRDGMTTTERLVVGAACMLVAAVCLLLGYRRVGLRWVGAFALAPGLFFAIDLLWLGPARPPRAIALQKIAVVSEPRADLVPVATLRAGVAVEVLGGDSGSFVRVRVGDKSGYAPSADVAVVR